MQESAFKDLTRECKRVSKKLTDGCVDRKGNTLMAVPKPGGFKIVEDVEVTIGEAVQFQYRLYGTRRHSWVNAEDCLTSEQWKVVKPLIEEVFGF